jgi:hypothetical protein
MIAAVTAGLISPDPLRASGPQGASSSAGSPEFAALVEVGGVAACAEARVATAAESEASTEEEVPDGADPGAMPQPLPSESGLLQSGLLLAGQCRDGAGSLASPPAGAGPAQGSVPVEPGRAAHGTSLPAAPLDPMLRVQAGDGAATAEIAADATAELAGAAPAEGAPDAARMSGALASDHEAVLQGQDPLRVADQSGRAAKALAQGLQADAAAQDPAGRPRPEASSGMVGEVAPTEDAPTEGTRAGPASAGAAPAGGLPIPIVPEQFRPGHPAHGPCRRCGPPAWEGRQFCELPPIPPALLLRDARPGPRWLVRRAVRQSWPKPRPASGAMPRPCPGRRPGRGGGPRLAGPTYRLP